MKKIDFTILGPLLIAFIFILSAVITSDDNYRYFCVTMFILILFNLQQYFRQLELKNKMDILNRKLEIYQDCLEKIKFIDEDHFNQLVLLIKQKLNDKK